MSKAKRNYDVFLSYALNERPAAEKVAQALSNGRLSVFHSEDVPPGSSVSEAVRHALEISDALVLILSSEGLLAANTAIELGAAVAWKKPVYVVRPENGHVRMPTYLSGYPAYPMSRVDDVVQAVKKGPAPLSQAEQVALKEVYLEMNTPTDRLLRDPAMLDKLADRFRNRSGSDLDGERLLYEMIRLRKKGQWPRLKKGRARTA